MPALLSALSTIYNSPPTTLTKRQNLPRDAYQPGLVIGIALGCFFGLLALVLLGVLICAGPSAFRLTPRGPDDDLEGSVFSRSTEGGLGGLHWMDSFRQIFTMSTHVESSAGSSVSSGRRRRGRKPRARVRYVRPGMAEEDDVESRMMDAEAMEGKGVRVQGKGRTTRTERRKIPKGIQVVEARPDGEMVVEARPDDDDESDGQQVIDVEPSVVSSRRSGTVRDAQHPDERRARGRAGKPMDIPKAAGWGIWK